MACQKGYYIIFMSLDLKYHLLQLGNQIINSIRTTQIHHTQIIGVACLENESKIMILIP